MGLILFADGRQGGSCYAHIPSIALRLTIGLLEFGHGCRIDPFLSGKIYLNVLFLSCNGPCLSCSHAGGASFSNKGSLLSLPFINYSASGLLVGFELLPLEPRQATFRPFPSAQIFSPT